MRRSGSSRDGGGRPDPDPDPAPAPPAPPAVPSRSRSESRGGVVPASLGRLLWEEKADLDVGAEGPPGETAEEEGGGGAGGGRRRGVRPRGEGGLRVRRHDGALPAAAAAAAMPVGGRAPGAVDASSAVDGTASRRRGSRRRRLLFLPHFPSRPRLAPWAKVVAVPLEEVALGHREVADGAEAEALPGCPALGVAAGQYQAMLAQGGDGQVGRLCRVTLRHRSGLAGHAAPRRRSPGGLARRPGPGHPGRCSGTYPGRSPVRRWGSGRVRRLGGRGVHPRRSWSSGGGVLLLHAVLLLLRRRRRRRRRRMMSGQGRHAVAVVGMGEGVGVGRLMVLVGMVLGRVGGVVGPAAAGDAAAGDAVGAPGRRCLRGRGAGEGGRAAAWMDRGGAAAGGMAAYGGVPSPGSGP